MSAPFFSVVIPTYRRPALLKQAVASVLAQTFADVEVVISDDDPDSVLTPESVAPAARNGIKVRVVRNGGQRGQSGNTNNGIRHAEGQWLKLLHDDDVLYPACLERFHAFLGAAAVHGAVATACCRSDSLSPSGAVLRRWAPRDGEPAAQLLASKWTVLAMYLQEDVGESLPSSLCINRDLLASRAVWMPENDGFVSAVDTHWAIRLAALGDRLIINESLVGKRDEPESITGRITDEQLDSEFHAIRELQFNEIPSELSPPPLHVAKQALLIRRAAHRLARRRQPVSAAVLAARAWDPRSWLLAARPWLSQRLPAAFPSTPRVSVNAPLDNAAAGSATR
jgi:glycosyltransferase involved in cell wall biosynthesis